MSAAPAEAITLPAAKEVRLTNGALVIFAVKREVPLIAFHALIRAGSVSDPSSREGVASLTADLLRKGAGKRSAQDIAAQVDGLGASLNTGAGLEVSWVASEFMTRDQAVMLDLLADVLRRPTFPEDEFEKLKSQSIDETVSEKDDPPSVIGEYAYAFFYGAHPYARPTDGDEATLRAITREDVRSYYRANYGGDRLILSIAGDFDPAKMEALVRARFGDWPKAPSAPPEPPAPTRSKGRRVLLVDKPDATQSYFWIGNLGVARLDPDRVPLDVANTAYGGRYTSILNTELRIQGGLTYGARWQGLRFGQPGTVAIYSYTKTETTAKAVDKALATLAAVRSAGIDSLTLASAKTYIEGQFPPRLETEDQIAAALADLAFYHLDRKELEDYTARVEDVGGSEVKRVVSRVYPSSEDLVFVFVGNAAALRPVVKKYGPVTEIKISDPMTMKLFPAHR
jgi:zinc protease